MTQNISQFKLSWLPPVEKEIFGITSISESYKILQVRNMYIYCVGTEMLIFQIFRSKRAKEAEEIELEIAFLHKINLYFLADNEGEISY